MRLASLLLASILTVLVACSRPETGSAVTASPSPASTDPARPLPSPFPDVVARVDGQPIRFAQIVPMARREMANLPEEERESSRPVAVRRALERYIDRELLFQEARSRGISADQRALDHSYDRARLEHPGEEEWVAFLAEEGLDPQSFRMEMRIQHTVSGLLQAETGGAPVGDDEARSAYEANPSAFVPADQAPPPFDSVREEVTAVLRQQRFEEITNRLLQKLRARARIETFL